jgi:hypothetical protein
LRVYGFEAKLPLRDLIHDALGFTVLF